MWGSSAGRATAATLSCGAAQAPPARGNSLQGGRKDCLPLGTSCTAGVVPPHSWQQHSLQAALNVCCNGKGGVQAPFWCTRVWPFKRRSLPCTISDFGADGTYTFA